VPGLSHTPTGVKGGGYGTFTRTPPKKKMGGRNFRTNEVIRSTLQTIKHEQQEAQLSQIDRAMLRVIEYFAQDHSK